jgi:HrpA-like RNA helicase
MRKCVVSTNIAETSVTVGVQAIPDLKPYHGPTSA